MTEVGAFLDSLVNCYSLNSIGPTMEKISGPRRCMAVYISSAIATGSAMSYWLCKAPAVGASGAIFGLVGSYAMFILRHRNLTNDDGMGDLQHIARLIVLNMVIGLMAKGIDNWGHVLPYDVLLQELDVTNVRELEDFLINECMYVGIVREKLDQLRRCFEREEISDLNSLGA